jgi:alanine-glyoxylate transaminase/serine-glyoxylate transaminase/serine-pyruvate transaminase
MRALAAPALGHLDPQFLVLMDDLRARLHRVFRAPTDSFVFAVSGTGTAGMETAVANLVGPGTRALVVVTGYFGMRLVDMCLRYGADVRKVECEWGRAIDPGVVEQALKADKTDVVAMVHAETSTGVRNPAAEIVSLAKAHGALTIVDCVTSLGGVPVDMNAWGAAVCYSGSQKCLGAPSGLAPIAFAPAALERRVQCRSFYLDVSLLQDYWISRKYHHTMSSSLIYALDEGLAAIEDEGLEARWMRHADAHRLFADALDEMGLSLLPSAPERLPNLNAVNVPEGVDEAALRRELRETFNIEIGAGMGPLAGKIWRIGLMGAGATPAHVQLLSAAFGSALASCGHRSQKSASVGA